MSFIGKNPKVDELRLTPQSADPGNPAEGEIFRSDGTSRSEGLWEYRGGDWVQIGAATPQATSITSVDSPYSLTAATNVLFVDASSGAVTVNLPTAAGSAGLSFTIKAQDTTNDITVDPAGSETIDARSTYVLNADNTTLTITSNGTNWESTVTPNRFQTKILSANATVNGAMADLTFSNLIVGKVYEVMLQAEIRVNDGGSNGSAEAQITHDGSVIAVARNLSAGGDRGDQTASSVVRFKATATTLTFVAANATVNGYIAGNNTAGETFAQIEERNDLVETADF